MPTYTRCPRCGMFKFNRGEQLCENPDCGVVPRKATRKPPEDEAKSKISKMTDRELVAKLIQLAEYYAGGGLSADNRRLQGEVIEIGRALNQRGGITEMRRIFSMIPPMRGKRTVEMEWSGIGAWEA